MSVPTSIRSTEKSMPGEFSCGVCGCEDFSIAMVCERPGEFNDRMICKCCGAHHVSSP